jgi:hypothetical protein
MNTAACPARRAEAGYIEIHRRGTRRHLPGAQAHAAPERPRGGIGGPHIAFLDDRRLSFRELLLRGIDDG